MSDRKDGPRPADVADERGRFTTEEGLPGEPAMIPDTEADASAHRTEVDRDEPGPRLGTQGAAIDDLADPAAT